jgi:hypothetical protein
VKLEQPEREHDGDNYGRGERDEDLMFDSIVPDKDIFRASPSQLCDCDIVLRSSSGSPGRSSLTSENPQ